MAYSTVAQHHHHHHHHHYKQNPSSDSRNSEQENYQHYHNQSASGTFPGDAIDKSHEHAMEEYTTVTAPTQVTDRSHDDGPDEDDTTTIRSLDEVLSAAEEQEEMHDDDAHQSALGETCSVSTGATDEASSLGDWASHDTASRLKQQAFHPTQQPQHHHRRVPSWEVSPHNQFSSQAGRGSPAAVHLPPSFSPSAWSTQHQQQTNVASFRTEQGYHPSRTMGNANGNHWNQQAAQHTTPPRYAAGTDPSLPFLPSTPGRGSRQNNTYAYHAQQHPQQQQLRKPYSQPPLPPSSTNTPPRGASERGGRGHSRTLASGQSPHRGQQSQQTGGSASSSGGGGSRSSSEILKTLLRKKACLYEPDTSRAVALVTWLVGRELALQYGFFSRQQLQAGVHACVARKIDSGAITRTKVNRCMQIILNSCFHYIIPRPDGTEENGDVFRKVFAREMKEDSFLLSILPAPWNDISVSHDTVLTAALEDADIKSPKKSAYETPANSPKLTGLSEKGSPGKESVDGDSSESKRAVLLCFNENVRSAEDVFRCHNEFIRDTAHASHLQLSSNEWRVFFGREAASTPRLWGNIGIPVPYMEGQGPSQTDALGVFVSDEAGCFRTTWCSKRYEHDHELCGFAHSEVNGGWLRRNPRILHYKDEMCPYVTTNLLDQRDTSKIVIINECPHGNQCSLAHSLEEIMYHPRRYKQNVCSSVGRVGGCTLGDVCPNFHPADSYRFPKKSDSRSPRHSRQSGQHASNPNKTGSNTPQLKSSPVLYAYPAPMSRFESHLVMPGLKNLYRRQSAVVRATIRSGNKLVCSYGLFSDNDGIDNQDQGKKGSMTHIGPPKKLGG